MAIFARSAAPHRRALLALRFLSHQDIEFFSAHSARRSYSSAILSIIAIGWGSFMSSARARFSAARMRHTRAFCHDDQKSWDARQSRNPKQPRLGFCCLTLRLLGLSGRGCRGMGYGHCRPNGPVVVAPAAPVVVAPAVVAPAPVVCGVGYRWHQRLRRAVVL